MIYRQDTLEKCIFPDVDSSPFEFIEKMEVDTVVARKKTLAIMETCKEILSVIDKIEKENKCW